MKKSYLIAFALSVLIILWMASGMLFSDQSSQSSPPRPAENTQADTLDQAKVSVQVQQQRAQPVQLFLKIQGQVEPDRQAMIRSKISGQVEAILVNNGEFVTQNTPLLKLKMDDRQAQLAQEEALVTARQQAYTRAQTLVKKSYQSKSFAEDALAALKASQANLAHIKLEIEHTEIRAPFDGIINRRHVEAGSFIQANTELFSFVDNNPLVVIAPIAQKNYPQIYNNAQAEVTLTTGEQRRGEVRFISPMAHENTRTFRVEVSLDNPNNTIPSGTSAEVKIFTQEVLAHFVSPGILSINTSGDIGIKTVDTNNKVIFNPIEIVQSSNEGIWVTGLAKQAKIITVGQGFVSQGLAVSVTMASSPASIPKPSTSKASPSKASPSKVTAQSSNGAQL